MFDFSFLEVLIVCLIGLIVVGPERLPAVARTLGLWIGRARAIATSVRTEFEREVNAAGMQETKRRLREETSKVHTGVSQEIEETRQAMGELDRAATESDTASSAPSRITTESAAAEPSGRASEDMGASSDVVPDGNRDDDANERR